MTIMEWTPTQRLPAVCKKRDQRCLSCGEALASRKRRYCSPDCRQRLHLSLNRRTGLLRALNTRYATFYFTDRTVFLDILPYGIDQIFTFILHRRAGEKPTRDFCTLSDMLGTVWWEEQRRSHKRYLASRLVLEKAMTAVTAVEEVVPVFTQVPKVRGGALAALRLDRSELQPSRLHEQIKSAYRRQAKTHHPDLGGDSASFRKIREAYEKLLEWAQRPSFTRKSGFPDKWLYDGSLARWLQPTP